MNAIVPAKPAALPTLPRDFDTIAVGMSSKQREEELRRRQSAFVKAKAELASWIRQDRNPLMTQTAKLVAAYLIECVNFETGRCFPTQETIADHLGLSTRQVKRLIPKIIAAGWISTVRVRRNGSSFYRFHAPDKAVKRIEEGALALRQNREDRRAERRFPVIIDHEPTPAQVAAMCASPEVTSMSPPPQFEVTSVAPPEVTSMSPKHLKGTPEIDSRLEEEEPLKVSTVPSANSYAQAKGIDDSNVPFEKPQSETDAVAILEALRQGSELSPGVMAFFRRQLMAGRLTPAMVEEQRRFAS